LICTFVNVGFGKIFIMPICEYFTPAGSMPAVVHGLQKYHVCV
jgi:hypothetical protein